MDRGTSHSNSVPELQPLVRLFAGYPLWWLLGIAPFVTLGTVAWIGYRIFKRRHEVVLPPGFLLWTLFLVWVVAGVMVLQVGAPGTVTDFSATRYLTWMFRLVWYLAATIMLLWVVSLRDRLPMHLVMRAVGWMFVTLVIGGYAGALFPHFQFQSLFELILPSRVTSVAFVRDLIHPNLAQVYTFEGSFNPRPSAPFPYTNDWGVTYACVMPFFVVGWIVRASGWRRGIGIALLIASVVPVVLSQNRGLWIALAAVVAFALLRLAVAGHARALLTSLPILLITVIIVLNSPLGAVFDDRVSNEGGSDSGRLALGEATVSTVVDRAPITGLGSTRTSTTSFSSINLADSANCERCTPPALGTQGQLWLVVFSQGVVGLLLYLGFLLRNLVSSLRLASAEVIGSCSVILAHLATMPFYNAIGPALLMIFMSCGVLSVMAATGRPMPRIDALTLHIRRNARTLVLITCLGLAGGLAWQTTQPQRLTVSTLVYIPSGPAELFPAARYDNLDLAAEFARSTAPVSGIPHGDQVGVSAIPNSRVLVLSTTDSSEVRGQQRTDEAAKKVGEVNDAMRDATAKNVTATQERQMLRYARGLSAVKRAATHGGPSPELTRRTRELQGLLDDAQRRRIELGLGGRESQGRVLGHKVGSLVADDWMIAGTSGLMMGLLGSALLLWIRQRDSGSPEATKRATSLVSAGR